MRRTASHLPKSRAKQFSATPAYAPRNGGQLQPVIDALKLLDLREKNIPIGRQEPTKKSSIQSLSIIQNPVALWVAVRFFEHRGGIASCPVGLSLTCTFLRPESDKDGEARLPPHDSAAVHVHSVVHQP